MKRTITGCLMAAYCGIVVSMPQPVAAAASLKQLALSSRDIPSSLGSFHVATPSSLGVPSGGLSGSNVPSSTRHAHGFQASSGAFLVAVNGSSSRILLIDDGVLRFGASDGARWYLGAMKRGAQLTGDKVTRVGIGSEGIVWSQAGSTRGTVIYLFWRHGRYVGEVTVFFRSQARSSDVVALARIADRKIGRLG